MKSPQPFLTPGEYEALETIAREHDWSPKKMAEHIIREYLEAVKVQKAKKKKIG